MNNDRDILSEEQFCKELVNRFFHRSSYFMHCINHEIEALVDGLESDDDDYLLLGHLMDRLVHSEDKLKELEELGAISGFSEFQKNLIAGVKYLRIADLDSERMKIEIEKLAQSMFANALDALQNDETKSELRRILGISVPQGQESDLKMDEPSFDEPVLSEPEFNLDRHVDLQSSMDEMDLNDENGLDTDVKSMGGYKEHSVADEDGSSKPVALDEPDSEISHEPASLVRAFEVDAETQLAQLRKHLQALKNQPDAPELWQESDSLFDAIIAGAMIYGFDGFEQLSAKARSLILRCKEDPDFDRLDAVAVLEETVDFLWTNIKVDPEKTDATAVRGLSRKLSSPPKRPHIEEMPAEESVKKNESDEAEFKIPGEDDEEILQLINEISKDTNNRHSSSRVTRITPVSSDDFAGFQQQAQLYYIIIEEALQVIENNREDAQAFEDLQIAASSLRDLVFKMKLVQISAFPDLLSSVAQNSLSTSYLLSDADHQLLLEAFEQFRQLRNTEDARAEDVIKVLGLLEELNARIQSFKHYQDKTNPHSKMQNSNSIEILGD